MGHGVREEVREEQEVKVDLPNPFGEVKVDIPNPFGEVKVDIPNPFGEVSVDILNQFGEVKVDIQNPFGEVDVDLQNPFGEVKVDIPNPFGETMVDIANPFGEVKVDIPDPFGELSEIDFAAALDTPPVSDDLKQNLPEHQQNMENIPQTKQGMSKNAFAAALNIVTTSEFVEHEPTMEIGFGPRKVTPVQPIFIIMHLE